MSTKSLLLFSIVLFSISAVAGTRTAGAQAGSPVLLADNVAANAPDQNVQNFQLGQSQSFDMGPSDDVCYRIRAYIFMRDDDHAPQLVRSTTCGPRAPHAKDAKWPDAKLVPAK
jgi:hypothetical protein